MKKRRNDAAETQVLFGHLGDRFDCCDLNVLYEERNLDKILSVYRANYQNHTSYHVLLQRQMTVSQQGNFNYIRPQFVKAKGHAYSLFSKNSRTGISKAYDFPEQVKFILFIRLLY